MIKKKILQTIKKYNMFKKRDEVLVCISGGFDSTCLLLVLNEFKEELSINLHCAHLNHMLRGRESDEDEKFVKKLTKELNIPLTIEKKSVKQIADKEKSSLEDTARKIRYEFFFKTADKNKIKKIALGHTKDDQAETYLMRVLKGAGLKGLSGIWPKRKIEKYTIIRPIIEISKDDVLSYLKKKNLRARLDSSNLSDIYLRNKIRLNLLPLLQREYNPNIKETLIKEADILRGTYRYIKEKSGRLFKKIAKTKKGKTELDLKRLKGKESFIIDELLRRCIQKTKGNLNKITFNHILIINRIIEESTGTTTIDLPDNLKVTKEYNILRFYKKRRGKRKRIKFSAKLKNPGITSISNLGLKIKTEIVSKNLYEERKNRNIEYFDYAKIKRPLILRFRKPQDKFMPLGMKKDKKIKKFFIDNKIPKNKRDKTLLLESNGKIIWVIGHRISDLVRVTKDTKKLLKAKIS